MIDITSQQLSRYTTGCAGAGVIAILGALWVAIILPGYTAEQAIAGVTVAALPGLLLGHLFVRWKISRLANQADSNVSDTREADPERETA